MTLDGSFSGQAEPHRIFEALRAAAAAIGPALRA